MRRNNYIKSEHSKLVDKGFKINYDLVGEMINKELSNRLKFDHTTKWYMHKLESVQENETLKNLGDFEIQVDHLILARRPVLELITKKKRFCYQVDFAALTDHRVKIKEFENIYKCLDLLTGGTGNPRKNRDDPDHSILKIGYNPEKSPGDLRRLFFNSQALVNDHQQEKVIEYEGHSDTNHSKRPWSNLSEKSLTPLQKVWGY